MNLATDRISNQNKSPQPVLETYSILLAEDDRHMADLLAANLRRLGHRVVGMGRNGREAVELASKTNPDVVILDIEMPILTGLQAAREILASRPVPIVMSTGVSDIRSLQNAADLKLVSYLVKPYSPAQLKVSIHLAVAQYRAFVQVESPAAT